jgi:hypothetical protein
VTGESPRRRVLACLGTGLAVGLAGCSSGGDGTADDGGADDSGDGSDETTDSQTGTSPSDTTGQGTGGITATGESAVEGLEIVDLERQGGNSNKILMFTTVRNAGDQTTDLSEYNYEMSLYDSEGDAIQGSRGYAKGDEVAPGDSGTINVSHSVEGDVADVARAEVSINCNGALIDGAYCQS